MEREQYEVMFQREDRHWWYSGMRRAALALLRQALRDTTAPLILDAGCGTGGTTLRYDTTAGQFIQNWQTPKAAGLCYLAVVTTSDGSTVSAYFKTK